MKRTLLLLIVIVSIAVLFASVTMRRSGGGEIVYEVEDNADVLFSHRYHVKHARLECSDCHIEIFRTSRGNFAKYNDGAMNVMPALERGELCGQCHNEDEAFSVITKSNCALCHSIERAPIGISEERSSEKYYPAITKESAKCIECHTIERPGIVGQWKDSAHFTANIGCYECHGADADAIDALKHHDTVISTIVSPEDCSRCHEKEVEQFSASHHAKGARILGSLDNRLAEVVEGNRAMVTPGIPEGTSAAAVNGCWQCHGSDVIVLENGKLDPATWPNTGIGRINPDGSEGSCSACHSRHRFSLELARSPKNCGKCHMGPDHPQLEIYEESKHGIAFDAFKDKMNLGAEEWVVGVDYDAAPTCATCHMASNREQRVSHDVGLRISWNNRPAKSIRPEVSDAKLGLPGKDLKWQTRKANMKKVCVTCHSENFVDGFYVQYNSLIELYNDKFAQPAMDLVALIKPLLKPVVFGNKIDFVWFELWHHEGRRARHGASMMGPDYTHWHGTYDLAKNFYAEFIPEVEEIIEENLHSKDPVKADAAQKAKARLHEILNSSDHKWYIDKMDPEEEKQREEALGEFKKRYKDGSSQK